MQKIKNVTQTVPYYLMPQNRPLTGFISLDFPKSADKHLPQNRPLTG